MKKQLLPLKILGQNARRLRLKLNLTQEELCEQGGFSYKRYQSLEGGQIKGLAFSSIEKLADLFDVEAWKLLHPTIIPEAKIKKVKPKRIEH